MESEKRNLVYACVFFNEGYVKLIELLGISLKFFGDIQKDTDLLIITSEKFKDKIQKVFDDISLHVKIHVLDLNTLLESAYARLLIFDYPNIDNYNKILYLDTDILITNKLKYVLDLELENKLYALQELNIGSNYHGAEFFDFAKFDRNLPAFTSGILLFNNCQEMKDLFAKILQHIRQHLSEGKPISMVLEQPFIIYNAINDNLYNNTQLIGKVINRPEIFNNETISHFSGDIGNNISKETRMTSYLKNMLSNLTVKTTIPEFFPNEFIDKINKGGFSLISKERLSNLYFQCKKFQTIECSFVECGVAKGGALALMKYVASEKNKVLGFDSFEGMPDVCEKDLGSYNRCDPKQWVGYDLSGGIENVKNTFKSLNVSLDNVSFVKGYFEDTAAKEKHQCGKIGVLRLDGDWYSSTKVCLDELYDQVIEGGVILIDDYGYFVGAKNATDEFRAKHKITSPLIQTDDTEFYWIKCSKRKVDILQVGAHIGNTGNDPIFSKIENYNDIILVEPVPYLFEQLKNNYSTKKNFNNMSFLNLAVSNHNGTTDLHIPSQSNDFSKLFGWTNQLASVNENHIKTFVPECIVEKITVETKTLNSLIEEHNIESIENLFTDTEGHDYEILMDLDLTKLKPKNIWFENKHMDGPKHVFDRNNCPRYNQLIKHFLEHGYEIIFENSEDTHIRLKDNIHIFQDLWTLSDEFRVHVKDFFKDKSVKSIAEIGSYKGYTTRFFSELFEKVYAVDNNLEFHNLSKKFNKDKDNIEYITLDIYNNEWKDLDSTIETVFIDAGHEYKHCKLDTIHSLKQFKDLHYVIFDDYGVWCGVKQTVEEFITKNILIFDQYVGLYNVPGPGNVIVRNVSEGAITHVNPFVKNFINKTYKWDNTGHITFSGGELDTSWGKGDYRILKDNFVEVSWSGFFHIIKFNEDFTGFMSIRKSDLNISTGL